MIRSVQTLDDLNYELQSTVFRLSRSSPDVSAENSFRKSNTDRMFAKSFADDMKDLYPLIGPDAINYFSNDDTARVPLGLGAENLQAPILIRVLYIKSDFQIITL